MHTLDRYVQNFSVTGVTTDDRVILYEKQVGRIQENLFIRRFVFEKNEFENSPSIARLG